MSCVCVCGALVCSRSSLVDQKTLTRKAGIQSCLRCARKPRHGGGGEKKNNKKKNPPPNAPPSPYVKTINIIGDL